MAFADYAKCEGFTIFSGAESNVYTSFGKFRRLLFFFLRYLYQKVIKRQDGFILGVFMAVLFSIRFMVEFVKESQGGFETTLPALSTGQWLSIPLIIAGLILMFATKKIKEA